MTTVARLRLSLVLFLVALAVLRGVADAQPPIVIKELAVEGNRRVQEAVILGRVKTAIGSTFSPSLLSDDLRSIFGLGFFDDVQMRVEDFEGGVKVTFVVKERPFIRDVDFLGNKRVGTSDLQEKVELKLGAVYNPVEVQRAREKLKDFYEDEGYFEVQITPEIETFTDGDVKVVFSINEGRRMTIDEVVIRGNKGLTDSQIKKAMATKERQYFILRGTVQRQRLEEDVERILALYNDHGYIQARVESHDTTVNREKARVTLTFVVVEGPQYRVGAIAFKGITLLPEAEVRRQLKFKSGDVFSRSKVRESMKAIADLYGTIGRASADINPLSEQVAATSKMNLTLEIIDGPEVYVERINITGNVRSQDKILRREIPMVEGDLFTLQTLEKARKRLVNLGFFEDVKVGTQPGSDKTKIVVNVDVTERPTGMFSIGGGFSSVDSFLGTVDLAQRNFLGRGWEASIRLRFGGNTQQGIISFTEPWLFDRPLAAGFDIFNTRRQFAEYDYDTLGGGLRLSHPFEEFWRWHLAYRITRDKVGNIRNTGFTALADQEGIHLTSMVSGSVTRDSRDSTLNPTRGGFTSIGVDFAGLAGDSRFVKTGVGGSYFYPIWLDHILSGRAEAGYGFGWADDPLPLFERYYLGGPNTIRSFKYRRLSPTDGGFRIGGTSELLGNLEYIVPLGFGIRLAGFFDIGNVYGFTAKFDPTDLRKAAGGGIRWHSPFGPIRVDYGINLDRKTGEDFGAFHFSVGSPF